MERLEQATLIAQQGRGGSRVQRMEQAIKSGVVNLEDRKTKPVETSEQPTRVLRS